MRRVGQYRDGIAVCVRNNQVGLAVAVNICGRDGIWVAARRVIYLGRKGAIAFVRQHRYLVAVCVCNYQIYLAITINICCRDRI